MATAVDQAPVYYLKRQAADPWSNYFRTRRFGLIAQEIRANTAAKGRFERVLGLPKSMMSIRRAG